ncbi:MAG: PAS domain-containing protein [Bacteroidales bacterium]|nr:PAS domain-containing protein [Bacteroidales bacterium]
MLGYAPNELDNNVYAFTKMIHHEDYEDAMQAMRDHVEGKTEKYEAEYRIRRKDGSYAWYYDKGGIVNRDANGKPTRVTGVVVDVSAAKAREEEINKLFKVFLQSPTPNLITSPNGTIEFVNDSHCSLTGYTSQELVGKKTNIFKSGKRQRCFL